jgi:hypothetical protein
MSRRQRSAAREKKPRATRHGNDTELMPPTEVRRLIELAGAGLRDPMWGSILGRIHLAGKISRAEFAAGKRWAELSAQYSVACQGPQATKSVKLDAPGGAALDPDSTAGLKEARRHARASAAYVDGKYALKQAGPAAERAVDAICVHDYVPTGFDELQALQGGLRALSAWWSSRRKSPAR